MKLTKIVSICLVALLAITTFSCASSGGGGGSGGGGAGMKWNFDNAEAGTQGWILVNSEFYRYSGSINLSHDSATLGIGLLRMDVDFTANKDYDWSEPKIANDFPRAMNMKGLMSFTFDFYYNPSLRTDGSFTAKIFSNSNGLKVDNVKEIAGGAEFANGFVKQEVTVLIMPTAGFMTDMRLSVAGVLTDYKGPVFFGNMRWE